MSNNHPNIDSLPIYKLFFDDVEELFLHRVSFRCLGIMALVTVIFLIGIVLILLYRSKKVFLSCIVPFIYTLVLYDFIQLLSLIMLKYSTHESYFNNLCRWPYYLKSSSSAGQCLTIIFIFILSRHQIRYFMTHSHLPRSSYLHSCSLTFVCLLFIVYVNNWVTHLKVEKIHVITFNETKYEINIQELPQSLYDLGDIMIDSHERFITDLDKYSQDYKRNVSLQYSQKISTDNIIHSQKEGSDHQILIKFPYQYFSNPMRNRSKRQIQASQQQISISNRTIDEDMYNNSYRIKRCTFGQRNFFLTNLLTLIESMTYFVLIVYYFSTIYAYKITGSTNKYHQQFYEKKYSSARRKSINREKQCLLLIRLKYFLNLIIYSHTFFTLIHLSYILLLTLTLWFVQTPFKWLPVKVFFNSLFLISYFSIPLRMILLFMFCFLSQFLKYIQSMIFYLFHTNLRFSWKFEKPTICFRLKCIPYQLDTQPNKYRMNSVVIDVSSSIADDPSNIMPQDSVIAYNDNNDNNNYPGVTAALLNTPCMIVNERISSASVIVRL